MNRHILPSAFLASMMLLAAPLVQAQVTAVPSALNFQGRLATPSGNPIPDGTHTLRFRFYDALTAGNIVYEQTLPNVPIKNGTFAVKIDGFTADKFHGNIWLGIAVDLDIELSPRTPILSVPYAIKSQLALTVPDDSITTAKLASSAASLAKVSGNVLFSSGGNIGIGTSTPGFALSFPNSLGDKISLWGQSGDHFGLGIQPSLLQIHSNNSGSDIAFGYGSSSSFSERMRIKGTGNVGIGTSDPQAKLHINGGVRVEGNAVLELGGGITKQTDAGKIGYQIYSDSLDIIGAGTEGGNRKIKFWNEGGATFTGGVTVGATEGGNAYALYAINTSGVPTIFAKNNGVGEAGRFQTGNASALVAINNSGFTTLIVQNSGNGQAGSFLTGNNSAIQATNNSTFPTLAVQNNGSAEAGNFQAGNSIAMRVLNNSAAPTFFAQNNGSGQAGYFTAGNANALQALNNSSDATVFARNSGSGAGAALQAGNGYALIATNSSNSPTLFARNIGNGQVGDFATANATCLSVSNNSLNFATLSVVNQIGSALNVFGNASDSVMNVANSGSGYAAIFSGRIRAQLYETPSDARFKTHIATFENALAAVLNLRGVTYDWNRDEWKDKHFSTRKQIGLIAQEVETVLPELVSTDANGYKSVNYIGVVPILVESVKTLKVKHENELKDRDTKIAELEATLKLLAERVNALEAAQRK